MFKRRHHLRCTNVLERLCVPVLIWRRTNNVQVELVVAMTRWLLLVYQSCYLDASVFVMCRFCVIKSYFLTHTTCISGWNVSSAPLPPRLLLSATATEL